MQPITLPPIRNTNVTLTLNWQIFTPQECAQIIAQAGAKNWDKRLPVGPGNTQIFPDEKKRSFIERQMLPLGKNSYPLEKICFSIGQINTDNWRFELNGVPADDMPWLIRQSKSTEQEENWHVDLGSGFTSSRKLSFIIQLSKPESYKGGDLEISNVPIPKDMLRKQGTIIVFPSYSLHRMSAITSGHSHYIAGWIHGNNFR